MAQLILNNLQRTKLLARLVGAILTAEGYQVQVAKPGADGGVDIIAGTGPMGFGQPRIAVQVKSGATPADVSVLRELQGVMPRFGADHGLIVSWSGFKDTVVREARQLFFEVRLWDSGDLVAALQKNFEHLSEELQAELPLKRIWLLVEPEA
jgi:restriction system protein